MYDTLLTFFLNSPGRLETLGQILSRSSFVLMIVGLYLRIGPLAAEIIHGISGLNPEPQTLATLYSSFPTWFIPEAAPGFIFVAMMGIVGWSATLFAKKIQRVYWQ